MTLLVDGARIAAFEGEPAAAAMLVAGRPVVSRSFRFHRPRGLMCSTGQCGWCECRVDGRPSVRSCRVPAVDGMRIEGEHALPAVRFDVLAALGLGARWIRPTFYHHRFLRPRRLRKRYLDVIRWFGGRGRLALLGADEAGGRSAPAGSPAPSGRPLQRIAVDVAIVGGGPAGLLAARAAATAGAHVLVLEGDAAVGGPWRWRDGPLPGTVGPLDHLVHALAGDPNVTVMVDTSVVSIDEGGIHALAPTALLDVAAGAVIVAGGSYERLPSVPGNDRPGVLGARTVEWLIRGHGIVPGETAVLVGSSADGDHAAEALIAAGARIAARVDTADLLAIDGRSHVTGVRVRGPGATHRLPADLVVVAERVPALEVLLAAGAERALDARGAIVAIADAEGRTSVPGMFVAGAAGGRPVGDAGDAEAAEAVGRTAAAWASMAAAARGPVEADPPPWAPGSAREPLRSVGPVAAGAAGTLLPPQAMICFCEDVRADDLAHERRHGYEDPELLKRRTGSLTGPCQGKYCATGFCAATMAGAGTMPPSLPTTRPPARPVRLGDLVRAAEPVSVMAPGAGPDPAPDPAPGAPSSR